MCPYGYIGKFKYGDLDGGMGLKVGDNVYPFEFSGQIAICPQG